MKLLSFTTGNFPHSFSVSPIVVFLFYINNAAAQDCNYYLQKAQEARAEAQKYRTQARNLGNNGSSPGGVSGTYITAAQAYENAASQYDSKASACSSGTNNSWSGSSTNNQSDALARQLNTFMQAMSAQQEREREAHATAERNARTELEAAEQRSLSHQAEYRQRKQSQLDMLNNAIEAELQRAQQKDTNKNSLVSANPRLVDPDCSIASSVLKQSIENIKTVSKLAYTSKDVSRELAAQASKLTKEQNVTLYNAKIDYETCINSPPSPANDVIAQKNSNSDVPSYVEFTKENGYIEVRNGIVSGSPPTSNDPDVQKYFMDRMRSVSEIYNKARPKSEGER